MEIKREFKTSVQIIHSRYYLWGTWTTVAESHLYSMKLLLILRCNNEGLKIGIWLYLESCIWIAYTLAILSRPALLSCYYNLDLSLILYSSLDKKSIFPFGEALSKEEKQFSAGESEESETRAGSLNLTQNLSLIDSEAQVSSSKEVYSNESNVCLEAKLFAASWLPQLNSIKFNSIQLIHTFIIYLHYIK